MASSDITVAIPAALRRPLYAALAAEAQRLLRAAALERRAPSTEDLGADPFAAAFAAPRDPARLTDLYERWSEIEPLAAALMGRAVRPADHAAWEAEVQIAVRDIEAEIGEADARAAGRIIDSGIS